MCFHRISCYTKGYKLYNLLTHSSFVSRDVRFFEHIMPYKLFSDVPSTPASDFPILIHPSSNLSTILALLLFFPPRTLLLPQQTSHILSLLQGDPLVSKLPHLGILTMPCALLLPHPPKFILLFLLKCPPLTPAILPMPYLPLIPLIFAMLLHNLNGLIP